MAVYKRGRIWWYKFRFAGQLICGSSKSTSKTIAKGAEQQRRRELELGFHNLKNVCIRRVRRLKDVIDEYLVGYRGQSLTQNMPWAMFRGGWDPS